MSLTRTTITRHADGTHTLVVRSQQVPSIHARRGRLPTVAAAHRIAPELREHVLKMVERAKQEDFA